jgi:hypothetical protein
MTWQPTTSNSWYDAFPKQTGITSNHNKGADIGSVRSSDDPTFVRFFNPCIDSWDEHFERDAYQNILGRTNIGQATVRIYGFNAEARLLERRAVAGEA